MKTLSLSHLSLVLLVGPSGSGKSTFARRAFKPTEVVSSDHYRAVVCDDEANQGASGDAFELVHRVAEMRLKRRRLTVIDATNLRAADRKGFLDLAKQYHYNTAAIVFDVPDETCRAHNAARPGRTVPDYALTAQRAAFAAAAEALKGEGVGRVHVLRSPEEAASAVIDREPLRGDKRGESGPFDIIGDVHGCLDELLSLLSALGHRVGYETDPAGDTRLVVEPIPGRTLVFVGDLCDRGPDTPGVYRVVMDLVRRGKAMCVIGNHDHKLRRHLRGSKVKPTHGLAETIAQLEATPAEFREEVRAFIDAMPSHLVLDHFNLVVAHGGLSADLQGRVGGKVTNMALYGATTGKLDADGFPERLDWAADYKGRAMVVYGHTPVDAPRWKNNTVNIDTGCVFGGALTAVRYPERETVSVPARRAYCDRGGRKEGDGGEAREEIG